MSISLSLSRSASPDVRFDTCQRAGALLGAPAHRGRGRGTGALTVEGPRMRLVLARKCVKLLELALAAVAVDMG